MAERAGVLQTRPVRHAVGNRWGYLAMVSSPAARRSCPDSLPRMRLDIRAAARRVQNKGSRCYAVSVPCSALGNSLFRLQLESRPSARKPRYDCLRAMSRHQKSARMRANSLQFSLIRGISAEAGSLETQPTATYLRATGNGGFFFAKPRVARPTAGWPILCLHKAGVDALEKRGHSHIQRWCTPPAHWWGPADRQRTTRHAVSCASARPLTEPK